MVSQYVWIGITVGVFFAGLGIGFVGLQSASSIPPMMINSQQMQQMMNDPQIMNQWNQQMMNDPRQRQQMMDEIMKDPQMMQSMMNNQDTMNTMMGQGMMGSGMITSQSLASLESLQTSDEPQTRTFDIILDEMEFFADVENKEGQESTALVELHRWSPNLIVVNEGDTVVLNISNPRKHTHSFSIPEFGLTTKVLDSRTGNETIQFTANKAGVFTFSCGLPYNAASGQCDPDHSMMTGTLIVIG